MKIRKFSISIDASNEFVEKGPGGAPVAFRIWKAGENQSDEGPTFFTEESAAALVGEQEARARRYSIDFDHLSLQTNRPAESGRAAGWHSLEVRDGDLWAVAVEWCADVKAGLEEDPPRWRYFSPAFRTDKESVVRSYINLALCINPLTHGLVSLASIQPNKEEKETEPMDPKEALKALLSGAECSDEMKAAIHAYFLEEKEETKAEEEPAKAEEEPKKEEEEKQMHHGDGPAHCNKKSETSDELTRQGERIDALAMQMKAMLSKLQAPTAQRMSTPTQGDAVKTNPAEADESFDVIQRAFGLKKDEVKSPGRDESGRWVVPSIDPNYIRTFADKKGA